LGFLILQRRHQKLLGGTDGCTANQERKRKETITLFATRKICFGQILVGIMGVSKDDMQTVMPGNL
jgi:hypothetical protein